MGYWILAHLHVYALFNFSWDRLKCGLCGYQPFKSRNGSSAVGPPTGLSASKSRGSRLVNLSCIYVIIFHPSSNEIFKVYG
jgi:hypothetical protein